MQHTLGRLFLPTFDGSPMCTAKAWVRNLDTYFQLHQVSEVEVIKVVVMHLEGKSHDWWFHVLSTLSHENVATYAKFTRG